MRDKFSLFGRTRNLENEIDEFFGKLSEASVMFKLAVKLYMKHGPEGEFQDKLASVNALESQADGLRRQIEKELYTHTLIPDSRGDVLGLVETIDEVLSLYESALWAFSIERPDIPDEFKPGFRQLTSMAVKSVDQLVFGARAFFRSPAEVAGYNHKIMLYEKEADRISTNLKIEIFRSDIDLSRKLHLREFVEHIDNVADQAEDVADRLAIYAIKRTA